MNRWVEISFDCLPLRSVGRLDIPLDASPKYREQCLRLKAALEKHGSHNTYFIYNAHCTYRLTNRDDVGMIEFRLEGTVLTDDDDRRTKHCDLAVSLLRETCDWLTQPVVQWFSETVSRSLAAEFDRYIEAGDLDQTKRRIEKLRAACDESGGYLGMYL